jgi:hypothetical protein
MILASFIRELLNKLSQNVRTEYTLYFRESKYSKQNAPADASVAARAILLVIEERMDGATIEGAIEDESLDEGDSCRINRLPTRPRSDGAVAEDVSFDDGGSSEGSMPASSYERDKSAALNTVVQYSYTSKRKSSTDIGSGNDEGSLVARPGGARPGGKR